MPLGVALVVLSAGVLAAPAGTQSLERAEALVTRGRELSHNYGHHAARQLIKAYQAQSIAAAAAQKLNPQSDTSQLLTKIAAGIGVGLFMNAYSRFEESEADRYGASGSRTVRPCTGMARPARTIRSSQLRSPTGRSRTVRPAAYAPGATVSAIVPPASRRRIGTLSRGAISGTDVPCTITENATTTHIAPPPWFMSSQID